MQLILVTQLVVALHLISHQHACSVQLCRLDSNLNTSNESKMKYNKIIYTALIAGLLGAGGCSKEKFSINSNPDDVTEASVTPSVLLPGALQATATNFAADY